jgi:uncharacterized PurR-regulated membrane protein YhhQ (DUF165 family)
MVALAETERERTRNDVIWLAGYVLSIVGANWLLVTFGVVPIGLGLAAPAGVFAAGLTFSLRDAVRERLGYWWALAAVALGALLSAFLSPQLALASGIAFGLSEGLDALVYEPLRKRGWLRAVAASNVVGFTVDSAVFLLLAFGSLEFLAGQVWGKALMTLAAIGVLGAWRQWRRGVYVPDGQPA